VTCQRRAPGGQIVGAGWTPDEGEAVGSDRPPVLGPAGGRLARQRSAPLTRSRASMVLVLIGTVRPEHDVTATTGGRSVGPSPRHLPEQASHLEIERLGASGPERSAADRRPRPAPPESRSSRPAGSSQQLANPGQRVDAVQALSKIEHQRLSVSTRPPSSAAARPRNGGSYHRRTRPGVGPGSRRPSGGPSRRITALASAVQTLPPPTLADRSGTRRPDRWPRAASAAVQLPRRSPLPLRRNTSPLRPATYHVSCAKAGCPDVTTAAVGPVGAYRRLWPRPPVRAVFGSNHQHSVVQHERLVRRTHPASPPRADCALPHSSLAGIAASEPSRLAT
jgi:hypothetical protein